METTTQANLDYETTIKRARQAHESGDGPTAYALFARASEMEPNDPGGWRGRAQTTTNPDDALLSWAFAVALDPADEKARRTLSDRLESRVREVEDGDSSTLVLLGQELAAVGLARDAHTLFQRAAELNQLDEEALVWQAATTDDPAEARAALEQAIALNPRDTRAQAGLEAVTTQADAVAAPTYFDEGPAESTDVTEAQPLTERVRAEGKSGEESKPSPDDEAVAPLLAQARAAFDQGDKERGYELLIRATETAPRSEQAWLQRAAATDDIDEALTCYEQVLAINPDNGAAREQRTFLRVRKLREGVRKEPEPTNDRRRLSGRERGTTAGTAASSPSRSRGRVLLLVVLILVLVVATVLLYLRLSQG